MPREIYQRRSLLYQFVLKELKTRYARPALGFFWAFLSPFLTVAIFYLIFGAILKIRTEGVPFVLYLMSAVFPWNFFQDSLLSSTTSLVQNKNLIRESNFPHYLVPLSIIMGNLVNFLPTLVVVIITSLFMLKGLPVFIVLLPAVVLLQAGVTFGLSVIFSIFYVRWRDTKYILDAALLLLFYLTPVFYTLELVKVTFPPSLFSLYLCNPLVGILNLYRLALLKGFYSQLQSSCSIFSLAVLPIAFAAAIIALGIYIYNRNKNTINDYLSY